MTKPVMVILTGLFFTKSGNQSLLNSLIGYSNEYKLELCTAAALDNSIYLPKLSWPAIPGMRVTGVWPRLSWMRRSGKTGRTESSCADGEGQSELLVNSGTSWLTLVAFLMRAFLLAAAGAWKLHRTKAKIVCVYEINSLPMVGVLRRLFPKVIFFGKFQGSALGIALDQLERPAIASQYKLDLISLKYLEKLEFAIMTNDGTRGDEVMTRFGLAADRVLHIPNGVDDRFLLSSHSLEDRRASLVSGDVTIRSISVSRLTPWKRVPAILHSIRAVVSHGGRIHHTLVGAGTPAEIRGIKSLLDELDLRNHVEFLPNAEFELVRDRMLKADVLISLNSGSNVSNPIFEAVSLCIPVLTIQQDELTSILGKAARHCIFIDSDEPDLSTAAANALLMVRRVDLLDMGCGLATDRVVLSWRERSLKEIEFINRFLADRASVSG